MCCRNNRWIYLENNKGIKIFEGRKVKDGERRLLEGRGEKMCEEGGD